jgi:hypothetical protein
MAAEKNRLMLRPCAVEPHVRRLKRGSESFQDATALRRGASRLLLKKLRAFCPEAMRLWVTRERKVPRRTAVAFYLAL